MGLVIQITLTFTLADKAEKSHDEGENSQVYTDKARIQVILDMKSITGRDKNIEKYQNVSFSLSIKLLLSIILCYLLVLR